jgi:hypothetical protein
VHRTGNVWKCGEVYRTGFFAPIRPQRFSAQSKHMKEITTQVEEFQVCKNPDHWQNMIIDGKCFSCQAEFAEFLDDDEMKHKEPPSDEEIDGMYALSESENYHLAH